MKNNFVYPIKIVGRDIEVVSHENWHRHLDETLGLLALHLAADEEFLDRYAPDGKIYLGVGADEVGEGRAFDEHPYHEKGICAKENDTASTLLLKALPTTRRDLMRSPTFKNIVNFVADKDMHATAHPDDISSFTKDVASFYSEKETIDWSLQALLWKFKESDLSKKLSNFSVDYIYHLARRIEPDQEQKRERWYEIVKNVREKRKDAFRKAGEDYCAYARIDSIRVLFRGKERKIFIASIVSDSIRMHKFFHSDAAKKAKKFAHVLILGRPSGNFQIFSSVEWISLSYVAAFLRIAERKKKRLVSSFVDHHDVLMARGEIEGAKEIYYTAKGEMILNGSLSNETVAPSSLSSKEKRVMTKLGIRRMYRPDSKFGTL